MAEQSTDSNSQQQLTTALRHSLKAGGSLFAIGCLLASAAAHAQDDPAAAAAADATGEEDSAIIVTGIRASLESAQNIKRNSDTVVDAITAQDIGALPDRSVTEALQRVPGVSINRFAGSNDPDHFSVEGSGVVIRGLNFVRSEFNGRDAFSAGVGGQSLNFADVPSELLGSVEIYKNATAEMIEGGLAGTVNLNTRKPFDNRGFHIALLGRGQLRRLRQGMDADRLDPGQQHLGHRLRHVRPARQRLVLADQEPRRRPPGDQLPDPRRHAGPLPERRRRARLPQSAAEQRQHHRRLPAGRQRPAARPQTAGADGFADSAGRCLCAARRPVPHAGLRPQARRRRGGHAVGIARRRFAADRAVHPLAHHQCLGRAHLRDRARPVGVQHLSARLPPERQRPAVQRQRHHARRMPDQRQRPVLLQRQRPRQRQSRRNRRPTATTSTTRTACSRAATSRCRAPAGAPPAAATARPTGCRRAACSRACRAARSTRRTPSPTTA